MTPKLKLLPASTKPVDNVETGAEAKKYRMQCGVTQQAVADKIGIGRIALLLREKGEFKWSQESFDLYINAVNQLK